MENIITNIKYGAMIDSDSYKNLSGFDLARKIADENEQKTGHRTMVRRMLDYADIFDGERREHYSFDVFEVFDVD